MSQQEQRSRTDGKAKRVLVVDDHPIVRKGLTELINYEKDLVVCGQAEDASYAIEAIKALTPDVVVVDLSLEGRSGLDLTKDIKAQYPALPVLVLSMYDEALYAERALRAGAKGYLMKQEATEKVITAIRKVLSGHICVSDALAERMISRTFAGRPQQDASAVECLSDRELEVFRLIGEGHGTSQIAQKLHLSIKTIETYRAHIKEKLHLKNATELLKYAIEWVNRDMLGSFG